MSMIQDIKRNGLSKNKRKIKIILMRKNQYC